MLDGAPETWVPPEWLDYLLWATVAITAIWVISSLFIYMRRKASNLTPVNAANAKKSAAPDFLKVDHKAREAAIARGEAYDEQLAARERAEAEAAGEIEKQPVGILARLSGIAAFLFSLFSLAGGLFGAIWQMDRMTDTLGSSDKLMLIVQKYPIPVAIVAFVILYQIVTFITERKWEPKKA